ncbi:MAG: hypothetical protein RIC87_04510 [Kiloniellales bacterium]
MSGYFQRLTRSAQGKETVLQPTTPTSAYLAQPLAEAVPEEALLSTSARPSEARRQQGRPENAVFDGQGEADAASPKPLAEQELSRTIETSAIQQSAQPIEPEEAPTQPISLKSPRPGSAARPAEAPVATDSPTTAPAKTTGLMAPLATPEQAKPDHAEPLTRDPLEPQAAFRHTAARDLDRPSGAAKQTAPPEPKALPRLVPAAENSRSEARSLPAFKPAQAPQQPSDSDSTEVHISIGRIEITADAAPAAQEKPKRRRQPTSLESYLAARDGGRR